MLSSVSYHTNCVLVISSAEKCRAADLVRRFQLSVGGDGLLIRGRESTRCFTIDNVIDFFLAIRRINSIPRKANGTGCYFHARKS